MIMKIKIETMKKFENFEIYQNIDEFYKMNFECVIDNIFNHVNDVIQLTQNLQKMCESYENFKKQIESNKIENYIVVCDFLHEKIYIYDVNKYNIFYIDMNDIFDCEFDLKLCCVSRDDYNKILCTILNIFIIDELNKK